MVYLCIFLLVLIFFSTEFYDVRRNLGAKKIDRADRDEYVAECNTYRDNWIRPIARIFWILLLAVTILLFLPADSVPGSIAKYIAILKENWMIVIGAYLFGGILWMISRRLDEDNAQTGRGLLIFGGALLLLALIGLPIYSAISSGGFKMPSGGAAILQKALGHDSTTATSGSSKSTAKPAPATKGTSKPAKSTSTTTSSPAKITKIKKQVAKKKAGLTRAQQDSLDIRLNLQILAFQKPLSQAEARGAVKNLRRLGHKAGTFSLTIPAMGELSDTVTLAGPSSVYPGMHARFMVDTLAGFVSEKLTKLPDGSEIRQWSLDSTVQQSVELRMFWADALWD